MTLLGIDDVSEDEVSIAKVKLGNSRVTGKEQYYTPPETADMILSEVAELIPNLSEHVFLEPAGGTGAFIESAFRSGCREVVSFDIEPKHSLVKFGSFLDQHFDFENAIAVSNPPFGRNNSLSIPFFNHAAKYCDLIVFIVPRSWRKWTVQNKLDRRFRLVKDIDLTIDYVDDQGAHTFGKNNLRTCVQFWQKSTELRQLYRVIDNNFISKVGFEEADVSLTIFGYSCGKVKTDFPRKANTTQMFLKLNHPKALEALESVDFSRFFNNTAYTPALSIVEINYLLNDYILGDPCMVNDDLDGLEFEEDVTE